jgi:tetratricopeptide (TPR) repeat protein
MLQWPAGRFCLSALKVICPKCARGQEVVGDIPAGGTDHVCVYCRTVFKVRPPTSRLTDDLPAAREAVPRPSDLPVSRDAIPRPGDLPVSRDAVPRPSDLPVSRDAIPRPGDLPVSRDAVPRPGDLPVSRDAIPRPGDLPVSRDAVPRPDDLPQSKGNARPGLLPGPERASSKTPPLGLALDLSLAPHAPATSGGPPLALDLSSPSPESPLGPAPSGLSLDMGGAADAPLSPSKAKAGPLKPHPAAAAAKGTGSAGSVTGRSGAAPPPIPASARVAPEAAPVPTLAPLTPTGTSAPKLAPLTPTGAPPAGSSPPGSKPSSGNVDLGFSLELEGDSGSQVGGATLPFPGARVASEGLAEAVAADHLPSLQPVAGRGLLRGGALRPVAKRARIPKWAIAVGAGVLAAGIAAAIFLPSSRRAPKVEQVIGPMTAGLLNDTPAAYQSAENQLAQVITPLQDEGDALRSKAAEITLLDVLVHGEDPSKTARAEQLLQAIKPSQKPIAGLQRAKALLAVAKGKAKEAEPTLGNEGGLAESQLVVALAWMAQGKAAAAVDPLHRYAAARPKELVAQYVLARALEEAGKPEARSEYEKVLSRNPEHFGAALGLARTAATPEQRLAAAQALVDRKQPAASSHELAQANFLWGQAALELGRSHDAEVILHKAISLDARLTSAPLALGELLLYEGRYDEALTTLQAPGAAVEATAAGQFALGGAYLATRKAEQSTRLLGMAAKAAPNDPRGAFWNGFAAATRQPPDLVGAGEGYREALKRDPKFLPASLRLAALLQQQNKAQESLTVLRAAEEAGAPPGILQLAWGDALIVAKEPVKAEEVFRKALQADPKSVQARLGVAAALQAEDKLTEAKAYLEETLKEMPTTLGLRERLAAVCLALGQKDEALVRYQDELKAGRVTPTLRLALARLALDLGKLELAQSEAKKVQDENPRNAESAYLLGRVHEARGELGAALAEYRRALMWEKLPPYNYAYGRVLLKVGKEQEAYVALDAASSLPEARMERGREYFRHGELDKALVDFKEASKMLPNSAEPLIFEGLCYDKMGQQPKAEAAWRDAVRVAPDASEPHYRLGRQEMDHGHPTAAIDHFRKAIAKMPANAPWASELYFQLGQAELLTGSKSGALAAFKKYVELAPQDAPSRPEAVKQVERLSSSNK